MAVRVTRLAPAAAQVAPDQEAREQSLRTLRLELEAQGDAGLAALLQHEIARLHEGRDDLASAARDELATTKRAAGFVEPLEALIDIATRSRSKANLTKLLERLSKLAQSQEEKLRAALGLALTHLSSDNFVAARETLESALAESPTEAVLWVALETVAASTGDTALLLKAALGRAAHAKSDEMRCLLLERVARLEVEVGTSQAAFAALRQSVDELPTWRALRAWEELGLRSFSYHEAEQAAAQTATILRAGLDEPEEASLYQIPAFELSEERAVAAQIRALIYAVKAGDDAGARGHCENLCETSPHSALALALLVEICRKQGDTEGVHDALVRLTAARKWSAAEGAFLHAQCALTADRCGREEEKRHALARLREVAPGGLLPRVEDWQAAVSSGSLDALAVLLKSWAEPPFNEISTTSEQSATSRDTVDGDGLLLGAALLELLAQNADAARTTLGKRAASSDTLGTLLRYVAESLGENNAGLTLPPGVGTPEDRLAAQWERLRRSLVDGREAALGEETSGNSESPHDPWARFVLSLYFEGTTPTKAAPTASASTPGVTTPFEATQENDNEVRPSPQADDASEDAVVAILTQSDAPPSALEDNPPPSPISPLARDVSFAPSTEEVGTRGKLAKYLLSGDGGATFRKALSVFEIAGWGDDALLQREWVSNPSDPLLSGAYLQHLSARADTSLASRLRKAAERQEDGLLRAAWLLKSAAEELRQGNVRRAREAFDESEVFPNDTDLPVWFAAALGPRDPQSLLTEDNVEELDNPVEGASLVRRWAPTQWETVDFTAAPAALQLLRVLQNSTESLDALEYALDDTDLFSEAERAALALARSYPPHESESLIAATERWVRVSPSAASKLTHWVASVRSQRPDDQAKMIEALATELAEPALLAAVPATQLKKESREYYRKLLLEHRQEASGLSAQTLSWAALDQTEDSVSEQHAAELIRLSHVLDPGLSDPDAQAALLLAGYEYLTLGRFEDAILVFENLLGVIPGDLTLCHGIRVAAARVNRPDLEAIASCELAKATEENIKSAALWERAGVLFQDELNDREEAEKCFTAALVRSPGSRVSFERVYRFARDRNDRQRQVELIDARLDSADSESLVIDLHWEKARFCRMLGRRAVALRSLEELLRLAPDHLPALALAAELHLVDGRLEAAAEALRLVAKHPDTPPAERNAAGLHACDLFEQLKRHRDAVELLQVLDEYGVSGSAGLERRARALARSEDWGEAYRAFCALNDQQDQIEARLESAQMMLAIQRDHLREPEELKRSARAVLRDAPLDQDGIDVVLEQDFSSEERRRLLAGARSHARESLRRNPLNPPEIRRFADLCRDSGEDYLERIALGILGLTGKLPDAHQARHERLMASCLALPTQPLSKADLESISDPLQLGATGRYLALLSPFISAELDPSLEAMGFSSLMRTDEFSGSPHRAEIGIWMGCFGHSDFELYVGGSDPDLIRGVMGELPTILVGRGVPTPLTPRDRARVVVQLAALHHGTVVYLNHVPEDLQKWIRASEILAGGVPAGDRAEEVDELARVLSRAIPPGTREELAKLHAELGRFGVDLAHAPYVAMRGAARAACLAQGESKILRALPDLLPSDQDLLNAMMSDVVRFVLSQEFITIRRRIGLEGS